MKKVGFVILMLMANIAMGQVKAYKDMGDKSFAEKDYYTAAYYYDKALNDKSSSSKGTAVPYFSEGLSKKQLEKELGHITYNLAESYRLYHNDRQAEPWYKAVVDKYEASYPLARLWYGICLRSNNHYDESIAQLKLFIAAGKPTPEYIKTANKELNNSLFAKAQMIKPPLIKAVKMPGNFNADAGDFGISVSGGQFWFTSSRTITGSPRHTNQIYVRNKETAVQVTKVDFQTVEKADAQYSTPSLDASGKIMYLTIWYAKGSKAVVEIYQSKLTNKTWSTPQKLTSFVNTEGYSSMTPFVTPDGKRLYYASNKPGGFGGTDIWESDLDANGQPVNAVNLGNTINTPDDEQGPYYKPNEHRLVYSSKGLVGMGGFDLFESFDTDGHWTTPLNMGYPYNSTKDDLYYYPDDKDESTVYVSSDRESECCLNLIKVYFYSPLLTGTVIDCATNKLLRDAQVILIDSLTKQPIDSISTNRTAQYSFKLSTKHTYILRLQKPGYFTKNIPIPPITATKSDTLYNPTVCEQSYQVNRPIIINNIFYDFNKATLRVDSKIILNDLVMILLDNPKIRVELSSHTDSFGNDAYNMTLSQERAQACVDYIISRGVEPSRIIAMGYGKSRPIAPNTFPDGRDNPTGRQKNRRTEFKVLSN